MLKEDQKKINKNSPFKFNVAKAIAEAEKPKRNKQDMITLDRDEAKNLGRYDREK